MQVYKDAVGEHPLLDRARSWPLAVILSGCVPPDFPANEAGVYVVHERNRALYVGMAGNVSKRLTKHHHQLGQIVKAHPGARVSMLLYAWWNHPGAHAPPGSDAEKCFLALMPSLLRNYEAYCIRYYRPLYNREPGAASPFAKGLRE
jgi:hypothetical protein